MVFVRSLKPVLKKLIVGSRVEPFARKFHASLFPNHDNKKPDDLELLVANEAYNDQTRAVMSKVLNEKSNCIDVGAHSGAILKEIVDFAPLGQHFAFEPISDCYSQLKALFPSVNVYELALSDSAGVASFQHVTSNPEYSGLRKRRYDRPRETVMEIKVRTDLLDNIIPQSLHIDFIKIDVEGAELQVLRGAVKTIQRCKPVIVFEHGLGAADFYGTTPEMIDELLGSAGLKISLMESWLVNRGPLSRKQFADQFYNGKNFYFVAHP